MYQEMCVVFYMCWQSHLCSMIGLFVLVLHRVVFYLANTNELLTCVFYVCEMLLFDWST